MKEDLHHQLRKNFLPLKVMLPGWSRSSCCDCSCSGYSGILPLTRCVISGVLEYPRLRLLLTLGEDSLPYCPKLALLFSYSLKLARGLLGAGLSTQADCVMLMLLVGAGSQEERALLRQRETSSSTWLRTSSLLTSRFLRKKGFSSLLSCTQGVRCCCLPPTPMLLIFIFISKSETRLLASSGLREKSRHLSRLLSLKVQLFSSGLAGIARRYYLQSSCCCSCDFWPGKWACSNFSNCTSRKGLGLWKGLF